jgi:hypothetical protein
MSYSRTGDLAHSASFNTYQQKRDAETPLVVAETPIDVADVL